MRLSELVGKEVINLTDATRLGLIKSAQALIDVDEGRLEALLVPCRDRRLLGAQHRLLAVPWRAIRRLGREIIIVEVKTPWRENERHKTLTLKST